MPGILEGIRMAPYASQTRRMWAFFRVARSSKFPFSGTRAIIRKVLRVVQGRLDSASQRGSASARSASASSNPSRLKVSSQRSSEPSQAWVKRQRVQGKESEEGPDVATSDLWISGEGKIKKRAMRPTCWTVGVR